MEYIPGEALSTLIKYAARQGERIEPRIAVSIVAGFLHGLHAAHEARNERGEPLEIVHRDVSPQNVLVGIDGVPRVVDFGVAKAVGRVHDDARGAAQREARVHVAGADPRNRGDAPLGHLRGVDRAVGVPRGAAPLRAG